MIRDILRADQKAFRFIPQAWERFFANHPQRGNDLVYLTSLEMILALWVNGSGAYRPHGEGVFYRSLSNNQYLISCFPHAPCSTILIVSQIMESRKEKKHGRDIQ